MRFALQEYLVADNGRGGIDLVVEEVCGQDFKLFGILYDLDFAGLPVEATEVEFIDVSGGLLFSAAPVALGPRHIGQ